MIDIINQVNDLLWGYVIIAVLVGCGVWFTVRMRFVQCHRGGWTWCRILDVGHGVVWCCHSLRGIYAGSVV